MMILFVMWQRWWLGFQPRSQKPEQKQSED